MQDFLHTLSDSNAYLIDGAMGSELYVRGFFINKCYDELNIKSPDVVLAIHKEYVRAGAEILETNTYGANRLKLSEFGLEDSLREVNVRAAEIAKEAAGDSCWVAGAMGPLGIRIEPYGPTSLDEAQEIFREQADALTAGGVDLFLLETFSNLAEIEQAILAIREASSLPVIAQMTINQDGRTAFGDSPAHIARSLEKMGADVIGLNCSVGPAIMLDAIEEMAGATNRRLSCLPNAGLPREVHGRKIYMASPD
ncbi:MAG: homocysteine S-methyltransferase family protein, partial [Thermoanaerobaculia bacterium]|nr:homocysteine S-methyltransferase family protein [Thermoanaerobaculia bacterium]